MLRLEYAQVTETKTTTKQIALTSLPFTAGIDRVVVKEADILG